MKNLEIPWSKKMTTKNVEEIIDFLEEFLHGQSYVVTLSGKTNNLIPEVKTNVCLLPDENSGKGVFMINDNNNVGFYVRDSSGVWEYSIPLIENKSVSDCTFCFDGKTLVITLNCQDDLSHRTITLQEKRVFDGKLVLSIDQKLLFKMALTKMYEDSNLDLCNFTENQDKFNGKNVTVNNVFNKFVYSF